MANIPTIRGNQASVPKAPKKKRRAYKPPPKVVEKKVHAEDGPRPYIKERIFVSVLGIVLIAGSWARVFLSSDKVMGANGRMEEIQTDLDIFKPFGEDSQERRWSNPEPSFVENRFCKGNTSTLACPDRMQHPFAEEFFRYGYAEEDFVPYLSWDEKTPTTDEGPVFDERRTYSNKSFKLFGE